MASLLKEFHRWCEAAQENMSAHWGSSLINDVLLSVSLAATATKTANQMLLERTRNPSHLPETSHAVKVLFDIETSLQPFLTAHRKLLELAWDDSPEDLNLRKRLMPNLSNFTKTLKDIVRSCQEISMRGFSKEVWDVFATLGDTFEFIGKGTSPRAFIV